MGSLRRPSFDGSSTSTINQNSRPRQRLPINEEPVFDTSAATGFTMAEEFSIYGERPALPDVEEFFGKKQIDPWRRMSALEHDCCLVVEFSELEGPKPSLCIPESPGAHFERNDFSVWLMTADYQASNHRGGPFFINEDIQMLISNEEQGVHTYAHHFTLFDIEARGYVRPFCVTYVTPDSEKLTRLFDSLRLEFSNILKTVKMCNRRQFRKALTEAVEALNVIETQAISSYYGLYYDGKIMTTTQQSQNEEINIIQSTNSSPSHKQQQQPADVLNTRYRRLQRELMVAQNVVTEDLRLRLCQSPSTSVSNSTCTSHLVNMDQWINLLRRGEGVENHRKTLKEFNELCPCVFDEFQRQMRSLWMKYRHWNTTSSWILESTNGNRNGYGYGAKVNLGSIPILYLPPFTEKKTRRNRLNDFSITEVDALHNLLHSSKNQQSNEIVDEQQKRLFLNIAPHLRYFLYPILTGQLLITYGSDLRRQLIVDLIQKLKFLIPTIFASPRCSLWNEDTSSLITESVLSDYKIMGLRVGQKEKIADFINEDMKKYVALLDLNNDIFHVAEYKGEILNRLMSRTSSHRTDWTLMMAIFTSISEYALLAYILFYSSSILMNSTTSMTPKTPTTTNGFFKWGTKNQKSNNDANSILKLQNGDMKIVKYLVELLKMQDDERENDRDGDQQKIHNEEKRESNYEDGLLLDYEPAHLHKL